MRVITFLLLLLLVACARPAIETVGVGQSASLISEGVLVLDVRTPTEFHSGHIDGARNIDYYDPTFAQQLSALDKELPYVVYCGSGKRSHNATVVMQRMGFRYVYDMEGGIAAWKSAGFPVTCEASVPCPR